MFDGLVLGLLIGLFAVAFLLGQIRKLRQMLRGLSERVAGLEARTREPATPPPAAEKAPVPASPLLVREPDLQIAEEAKLVSPVVPPPIAAAPRLVPAVPPPLPITPPPVPTPSAFNWEAFMGVKLFAWLGGLALFLGIVFLVKYSFENNLITPLGRLTIGGIVGAVLVAVGWWLARGQYRATAQSLCATGIVILYADLFAAHSFYLLISLTTAFFAMAAVTLFSFLLAVALDAQVIVILGLLGGFLTPFLLASGIDNAPALFLYIALLDLGIAAVALRKRWLYLLLLAAIGTVVTQVCWAAPWFNDTTGGRAFWIFLGFEALFLVIYFWNKRLTPNKWATAAACLIGLVALGFGFWICAFPLLVRSPLFFFSFIFLADAGLLALPVIGRAHRVIAAAAGFITFTLVATWIGVFTAPPPLNASLVAIIIFALLHAATTPAAAWRRSILPFTATGTFTPYVLLIILLDRLALFDPIPVFAIAFILTAILLTAAIVRRADWLSASALLGVALLEMVWQDDRFVTEAAGPALIWYGLFLLLFVAYPFCSAQKEKAWSWAISALAQALQFWLFYRSITLAWPNDRMGLLPAAFVVPAAIGVIALLRVYNAVPATGDVRLAWQGGALLLFVSLIFPLQFDREWITLGWALEGLALLCFFHRVPHRGLRVVAVVLLCAAFVRLAFNPAVFAYHRRSSMRIWNWYLYAYGIATLCLLGGARLFGRTKEKSIDRFGPPILGSLGAILAFLLLNLEIADYFSIGPTLTFSFTGNFARDMTYSIAWAVFALVLIVAGMKMKLRFARYAGVALLIVTLIKLFLHDLRDLSELYRIGAFVGVAVVLIAASFIYQRFLLPGRGEGNAVSTLNQ
ncbi:MAG TPA: DUF2339 domain-containing protein [Chthoniobacterales bacterium]|jgi:uncharacterized membrane protein